MYIYNATILRVVDGDTVDAAVDLGFDIHMNMKLRLMGINAPELSTLEGKNARDWLTTILAGENNQITIRTEKDRTEKYGRYLATLLIGDVSINQMMIDDGYAVVYTGGKR